MNSQSASKWNINTKAVALGFLSDIGGSIVLSLMLASAMAGAGMGQNDIIERMQSTNGLLLNLIMGLGCTVLGGYVAGRVAKREEIRHGVVVAVMSLLLGLFLEFFPEPDSLPRWYALIGYLFIIPAGMAGGHLAAERLKRLSSESEEYASSNS